MHYQNNLSYLTRRVVLGSLLFLIWMSIGVSVAQAQIMNSVIYPTAGNPVDAVVTSSGDVLVAINDGKLGLGTGIQVFTPTDNGSLQSSCVNMLWPSISTLTNGGKDLDLSLFPNGADLAAATGYPGEVFYHVADLLGCNATGYVVDQGSNNPNNVNSSDGAGTFDAVITLDGNYAFVANEYGVAPNATLGSGITLNSSYTLATLPGNIAVVQIERDSSGNFTGTKVVGNISTGGSSIPGILLSPDGTRLYVTSEVSEISPLSATQPAGNIDSATGYNTVSSTCSTGTSGNYVANGLLTVIDVAQVEASPAQPPQSAILSTVAAGCSPVRLAETSNGTTLWVAARGDNRVLAFSTAALESNPSAALLGDPSSGGISPVGIRLFHNDQWLAVANSDRFDPCTVTDITKVNATILEVSVPESVSLVQTIPTGCFPRDITVGPDDATLYLTNYSAKTLQVIQTSGTVATYYISGTITDSNGQPMPGVSVQVDSNSGSTYTTTTDLYGNYIVTGLTGNASYLVLPNETGYGITANGGNPFVAISNSSVAGQNYTGTLSAGYYTISGSIATSFGLPMVGVPISITNSSGSLRYTPKTNADGYYSQVVNNHQTYLIWPSESGYGFTVNSGLPFVAVSDASASGVNITGTWSSGYSISGSVMDSSGNPMAGVTISFDGQVTGNAPPATTNTNGDYSVAGFPGQTYDVWATQPNYAFSNPGLLQVNGNVSSVNFMGTPN